MLSSPFKVGDLVMFRNRCQHTEAGMRVEEVDFTLFGVRLKVDHKWWVPENFMSHSEWVKQCRKELQ